MFTLKIGIQTASLRQPLKRALQTAAELGADAVEIDGRNELRPNELSQTGVRQFRKLLSDLNLKVCALGFLTRRGYDVVDDLDRRVAATKDAMRLAYQLGAAVVVNQIGQVPSAAVLEDEANAEDRRRWRCLVEVLTDLGSFGQREGALLAAETGTEPGIDLARLLAALPPGATVATLDPGNLIVNSFSPLEAVRALGSSIAYVHIKDGVRDLARGRGLEVAVGRGSADFPELLGALEERGYRGYLTIERGESEDPVHEVGHAVQYLRNI